MRLRPQPLAGRSGAKAQLFDGLESDVSGSLSSPDLFLPRSSVKKLVIKPKSSNSPADVAASSAAALHDVSKSMCAYLVLRERYLLLERLACGS